MPKSIENLILFLFGGAIYSMIEVIFRGYTHFTDGSHHVPMSRC